LFVALSVAAFVIGLCFFIASVVAWCMSAYYLTVIRSWGGWTTATFDGIRTKRHLYYCMAAWLIFAVLGVLFTNFSGLLSR